VKQILKRLLAAQRKSVRAWLESTGGTGPEGEKTLDHVLFVFLAWLRAPPTYCVCCVSEGRQVLRQERVGQVEPEGGALHEGHVDAGVDDVPARQDGGARRAADLRQARQGRGSRGPGVRHAWRSVVLCGLRARQVASESANGLCRARSVRDWCASLPAVHGNCQR
jgi:hypothetical protein